MSEIAQAQAEEILTQYEAGETRPRSISPDVRTPLRQAAEPRPSAFTLKMVLYRPHFYLQKQKSSTPFFLILRAFGAQIMEI